MDKENLKNIIIDQKELIADKFKTEKIIKREGISRCKEYLKFPNIVLITGLRRSGKSIFAHLLTNGVEYPYINFDDERLLGIKTKDLNNILECFYELYPDFSFIFLDEIQNIKGWELFVNRLRNKYKIIITGSNANLLSSELATHLTGRFIAHPIFPLSFKEFLEFKSFTLKNNWLYSSKIKGRLNSLFSQYLISGGIFEYYKFGEEFLRSLFTSIINKDVSLRYKVKYPVVLEELALLLVNYFASKISVNNITKNLNLKSPHTIKKYIEYLENTFLIFTLTKFSYKIKERLATFKKIYVADNGIINSLTTNFSQNKGRLLENLAAIEFKRRSLLLDFEIFYWDNYNVECDFIIKKARKVVAAYQVCSEITERNREREIAGLVQALKEFRLKKGVILTHSLEEEIKAEGCNIKMVPLWKWLLQDKTAF